MSILVPILEFAYRLGFKGLYDWQSRILLRYEAGESVAAACANFTGKTSVIFPICGLWTLYNFPRARLMYMSATFDQVVKQFFAPLSRFSDHRYFSGWQWLEAEVRTNQGGFLFGRASDVGGHIEGIHDTAGSVAGLLIDEAKTIRGEIFDTLERCHVTFRLFMSSTGLAAGGFYEMMTRGAHLWKTFRVASSECGHVARAEIEADRANLKDSVWRVKHGAQWLYDAGESMISLEAVRRCLEEPGARVAGRVNGFCDFAGGGDESVLALCEGNVVRVVEAWRARDTMHSVGKFLALFRKLGLCSYQVGGDEGYGHQLMDRMAEEGFYLRRVNNGAGSTKPNLYTNLSAEWWSRFGELVEKKAIVLEADERLVAQLSSRQKEYDSKGREKLESKTDMRARGLESPDRADAVIGAVMLSEVGRGSSGGIGPRDLGGIRLGGERALFSGEGVSFGQEEERGVDIRELWRYP